MRTAVLFSAAMAATALGAVAIAATGERLARLNLEETELSAGQARNMSQLARLLSVLEQLRRDPPPALLVSPRDAKDAVRAAILVKAMTPELQRRAQVYAREAGEMMRQRRLAAVESEALFTAESEQADAAPEPGAASPLLRGPTPAPALSDAKLAAPAGLIAPVSGPLTRRFGDALGGGGRSNGLTWTPARASRVASPGAGLVQYVGPVKGWGVILILRLAGGYHLVLAGLERPTVTVGQSVAPGQPVGWMPDGRQSPSELYLEIREQGSPVDPARWIRNQTG
ncbi:murein hydrolase activator EnvC family protein [Phenylobacterium hankyongense]|nr:peptidoglycan DD-metalloendopeptidase family protein [Phenylobacterium hankyongense]